MTKINSKRIILLILIALLAFSCALLVPSVHADTGPKPSVVIEFKNMDDRLCYGTLLSKYESTGPASAWDGDENHIWCNDDNLSVWRAFVGYEDEDGYFYLQWHWRVDESKELAWTYYPPSPFKILLYYPDTDSFQVSGVIEKYAFHSYYSVDMSNGLDEVEQTLPVEVNYQYGKEIAWLIVRIILTILIELGIAWMFKLRSKKEILTILGVNTVTQIALNIALNVLNFYNGLWALIWYIPLELGVFIVESVVYCLTLRKMRQPEYSNGYCVLYTFCANVISFAVGAIMAIFISGLF
ncbi:MAG: hypothetical protein HDT28_02795 [Clostridiales bacterium]|nr:hypothetical protein [Clostridiales bacterium]